MKNMELFAVEDSVFKDMLKLYDRTEKMILEDVMKISDWMKTQPHLPEILNQSRIKNFLMLNKCSIEKTKKKIDMYYTIRSLIPDMFENINPELPKMKEVLDISYWMPLPKLTKEMYRVFINKVRDKNMLGEMEPHDFIANILNVQEIRLKEDHILGDIFIVDFGVHSWRYLLKLTPTIMIKTLAIYEKVYSIPVKAVYVINSSPLFNTVETILKRIVKFKLFERIHIYPDSSILQERFPKEMLPKDYGGEEKSLEELQEIMKTKFVEYKQRFDQLDKMRVDEKLRPEKLENDDILGFHGNFKKLNVD